MDSSPATPGGPPRGPQFDNRRILAGVIDVVLVAVVAAVILYAAGVLGGDGTEMTGTLQLVVLAWALFYYFAMETGAGQTVGKRLMGVRVLTVDGEKAGYREVGVRTVLRVIDGIALYLVGLIVMLITGERRQRLGDLAAKTCVTSADWQPASGSVSGATAAAPVPTSAIVLPSAPVRPAGTAFETPESSVPDAPAVTAVPSPFTTFDDSPAPVVQPPVVADAPPPAFPAEAPVEEEPPVVADAPPPAFPAEAPVEEEPPVVAEQAAPAPDLIVDGPADGSWEPLPARTANGSAPPEPEHDEADEREPDERVRVRTVETLSAMDLLMSEIDEDEHAGRQSTG